MPPPHLTGGEPTVPAERAPALFLALELVEHVAASAFVSGQPHVDLEKQTLGTHPTQLDDLKAAAAMVVVAGAEVIRELEQSRRLGKLMRKPGEREASHAPGAGDDAGRNEAILWAIRQSLSLIETFISTSAHPRRLARDLVDRRTRHLPADHLRLIRTAADLAVLSSAKLLLVLSEAPEVRGKAPEVRGKKGRRE